MDAVVQDDGVPSPQEQQPKTKRRLSRLQHMTVNKQAASPSKDQELRRKASPAAKAGFSMPELTDAIQKDAPNQARQLDALPADAVTVADKHRSQQTSAPAANTVGEDFLVTEPPITTAAAAPAAAVSPQPTKASISESEPATAAAAEPVVSAAAAAPKPVRLQDSDLDDDDDDWEDQPAPFIPEDSIEQQEPSEAAQEAAAAAGDGAVPVYDPSNRRRAQYDDEDEWEQLLQKEKHAGTQAASGAESQGQEEVAQQGSVSGSASAQGDSDDDGDNILADDPDAVNASTQRMLRDVSANDCLGKGFKPLVAPLNSLLEKLAARQAALEAKAKRGGAAACAEAEAAVQPQPALTLEQLKAHLEQHSLGYKQHKTKQQHQQQPSVGDDAADAAAAADNDNGSKEPAAKEGNDIQAEENNADIGLDMEDDSDDLEIEPPQQQQEKQQPGSNMLLLETQELLDELHPAADAGAAGIISGTEAIVAGSTAPETGLDLQLDEDEGSDAVLDDAEDSKRDNDAGADDQEAGGADEGDGEGDEDEEELLNSSDEDMLSEDEDSDAEEQQQSSDIEAEPLPWEEEELHDSEGSQQQQNAEADAAAATGDKAAVKAKKLKAGVKRSRAAGGFVDAEADLSEDEEGQGLDSDEEEDSEDDAMLTELLADVKEGRLDEARRAALHAQWMHGQDGKDIEELIDNIKKGFRRKRKQVAGLDDDDDEGNNAAARRRRAELQGIIEAEGEDDEPMEGTDKLQRLDLMLADDEGEAEAAAAATAAELANRERQKKIHKLQLQTSESQQESDVIQLLSMDVDEGSQHTAALLSKSASLATAAHGAGHITGPDSNLGSLGAVAAAGAAKQGAAATAGSGLGKGAGIAAGGFTFQMFGKDVTNSSQPKQVAGSFLGRQASSSVTVRAASNYGASRSFVFGSDPSNYSNPGLAGHSQQQKEDPKHAAGGAVGPSSFAGLSKLIPEAAAKDASRLGPGSAATKQLGGGSGGSSLLHMLQEKKSGSTAAAGHSILKQHVDAVGAKFKANNSNSRSRAGDDATSRGAWDV